MTCNLSTKGNFKTRRIFINSEFDVVYTKFKNYINFKTKKLSILSKFYNFKANVALNKKRYLIKKEKSIK